MRRALAELGWKQSDLCRRVNMNKNTVSGWANQKPPAWVGEYLGAMLAIDRVHQSYVRPTKEGRKKDAANSAGDPGTGHRHTGGKSFRKVSEGVAKDG